MNVCVEVRDATADIDAEVDRRRRQREEDEARRQADQARRDRDREQNQRSGGDVSGSGSVSGSVDLGPWRIGDVINIGGDFVTVGSGDFYRICVRSNSLLAICRNAELVDTDVDFTIGRNQDQRNRGGVSGGGGGSIIVYRNGRTGQSIQ